MQSLRIRLPLTPIQRNGALFSVSKACQGNLSALLHIATNSSFSVEHFSHSRKINPTMTSDNAIARKPLQGLMVSSERMLHTTPPKLDIDAVGKFIGAGQAVSGLGGAAAGVGVVFASLISSYARNPSLKNSLFTYAILGFALAEAMGLFCILMAFIILNS